MTIANFQSGFRLIDGDALNVLVAAINASTTLLSATAGTVSASKAVVVDSSKDITGFRNVTATGTITGVTLAATAGITAVTSIAGATVSGSTSVSSPAVNVGSSGAAGSLSVFPATASKGKTLFTAADNTGNTTTTITTALQATTRTYTVPDAGANAKFVLQNAGTVTLSTNAGVMSTLAGVITTEALTTAAGDGQDLTITNTLCTTASIILVTRNGGTSTGGTPIIKAVPGNGSYVITLDNKHASAAFDGTFILGVLIVQP